MCFLLPVQHNIMVFIAELFWWFETVKPEFVQPRDLQEFKDCKCRTLEEDSTLFIVLLLTHLSFLNSSSHILINILFIYEV